MIDKLRVAGIMKNKLRAQRGVSFHNSGHEEFIKLILLLLTIGTTMLRSVIFV